MRFGLAILVAVLVCGLGQQASAQTTTTSTSTSTTIPSEAVSTVTRVENWGALFTKFVTVTGSADYRTGGDIFAAADFGLNRLILLDCPDVPPNAGAQNVDKAVVDMDTSRLLFYVDAAAGTEVTSGQDVSDVSLRCIAYGY